MSYKDLKLRVNHSELVGSGLTLLKLALPADVPEILPGQFVNILAPKCADVFLRRPISVCDVREGQLWILVKDLGRGSRAIGECRPGDELEVLLPLGLAAGACGLVGNWLGTTFFLEKGGRGVKPIMLGVLALFFLRVLGEG